MSQPIDNAVVSIRPDFKGFRNELRDGVVRASRNIVAHVGVRLDTSGFAKDLRTWANGQKSTIKVPVVADKTGLLKSIHDAVRQVGYAGKVKVGLEADWEPLRESIRLCVETMRPVKANITVDAQHVRRQVRDALGQGGGVAAPVIAAARQRATPSRGSRNNNLPNAQDLGILNQVIAAAGRLKLINWGGAGIKPLNLLYGTIAAISPALLAMAANAGYASTSIVALGAAAIGVAGGITAVTIAFGSITDYMTQYTASQKAAAQTTAKAATGNAKAAAKIAAADTQTAETLRTNAYAVTQARKSLIGSMRDETRAQADLNDARREAVRNLEDLRELSTDQARDEKGAILDLKKAREEQAVTNRNFFSTEADKAAAAQAVADAEDRLSDIRRDRKRTAEDLADAEKKGIKNADPVVAAQDRIAAATEQVAQAQEGLRTALFAQQQGLAGVAKAAAGGATATAGMSAADVELARQWGLMSKPAQELATWLKKHSDLFRGYRHKMERAVLPGFLTFLQHITDKAGRAKSALDILTDGAAQMGGVIGRTVARLGKEMDTDWFKNTWADINAENLKAFTNFSDAAVKLFKPIIRLIDAASPQLTRFSQFTEDMATKFADWIATFTDADLKGYFKGAADELAKWWKIGENIVVSLFNIFKIAIPGGSDLTTRLLGLTQAVKDWTASKDGQDKIKAFFDFFKKIDYEKVSKVVAEIVVMAALFKAGTFVANHPILTVLGLFAATYPAETMKFIQVVSSAMVGMLTYAAEHKDSVKLLGALFLAYKGITALKGGKFKLPGIDTATATMTVTAGVVYVNGGVAGGMPAGGKGAPPLIPGGKPGAPAAKPSGWKKFIPKGPKGGTLKEGAAGGIKGIIAAYILSTVLQDLLPDDAAKRLFATGPDHPFIDARPQLRAKKALPAAQKDEKSAFDRLNAFKAAHGGDLTHLSKKEQLEAQYLLDDYVRTRKESIRLYAVANSLGKTQSQVEGLIQGEMVKTRDTIAGVYTAYGTTWEKAKDLAAVVLGMPDNKTVTVNTNEKAAKATAARIASLKAQLAELTKPHPIFYGPFVPAAPRTGPGSASGDAKPPVAIPPEVMRPSPNQVDHMTQLGAELINGMWVGADAAKAKWIADINANMWSDFETPTKNAFGIKSPSVKMMPIGADLINGLWVGFTDRWLALAAAATQWVTDNVIGPLKATFTLGGAAISGAFGAAFGDLTASMAAPVKAALDWIDVNFIGKLNTMLSAVGVPILPLIKATAAAAGPPAGISLGNQLHHADGGPVPGFSPNPKADNINAALTAGEYVQPVDVVNHYGQPYMDALRRKELPRYADGGIVGNFKEGRGPGMVTNVAAEALKRAGTLADARDRLSFAGMGGGEIVGDMAVERIAEATARAMAATDKQILALIEAGIVESTMKNINFGDRDSIGFLQQRPSQGWGTPAQIMNVAYATRSFIRKAKKADKKNQTAGQLAQAVQKSGYPLRYDEAEANARTMINAEAPGIAGGFTGGGGAAIPGFGNWPSSPMAQRGDTGIWRRIVGLVKSSGIKTTFGNGYRPGDPLWHGSGRAVDFMGFNQDKLAQFFMARKPSVLELIHRTASADYGVTRGRNHAMPTQWPLHKNHLHVAMSQGGIVPRKYDAGGGLAPGLTLAYNGTGQTETVRTAAQEKQIAAGGNMRIDSRDLALLAQHIAVATSSTTINMDGRKVAEMVNNYNYLHGSP